MYAENKNRAHAEHPESQNHEKAKEIMDQIKTIKAHRHWAQPYVRLRSLHLHVFLRAETIFMSSAVLVCFRSLYIVIIDEWLVRPSYTSES